MKDDEHILRVFLDEDGPWGNSGGPGYVYILRATLPAACMPDRQPRTAHKIGQTRHVSIQPRIRAIRRQIGAPVTLMHQLATDSVQWAERWLHEEFDAQLITGEWFDLTPDDVAWLQTFDRLDMRLRARRPARLSSRPIRIVFGGGDES